MASNRGIIETFVRLFPDLVREAASSPLGIIALIVLVASLVIMVLFRRGHGLTLIAFLAFLVSITILGLQMAKVYPEVERENRELVVGPQAYDLSQDTRWTAPNIRIRGGTVVQTNGHDFGIEVTKGQLTIEGQATIRSFAPGTMPPVPPDKPPAARGANISEAGQCRNGLAGNRGVAGETGAVGLHGKDAGRIAILAPRATGSITIVNAGMDGGHGGRGGDGGTGGTGQRGGRGRQNYGPFNIPTDCACGGAFGGPGGPGGDAGSGGDGGRGGHGGEIVLRLDKADDFNAVVDTRGGLSGPLGPPGAPGEPGLGGLGGGGDGPACRDESNSRHGSNGTEQGQVPKMVNTTPVRAESGRVEGGTVSLQKISD